MFHTISLSPRPDPASLGREGKGVKDRGLGEGVKLYGRDNVFVLLFP